MGVAVRLRKDPVRGELFAVEREEEGPPGSAKAAGVTGQARPFGADGEADGFGRALINDEDLAVLRERFHGRCEGYLRAKGTIPCSWAMRHFSATKL